MTRKSKREIERALDDLEGSTDTDDGTDDAATFGDVVVSFEQPDDWEPDPDALVIDFTEVDT